MGQILHGSATTTHAIRAAIQRSKAPLKELASQYGLNHKTVAKWRKRAFVHDAAMGPKTPRSTVLSGEEEAMVIAFRKHTLLALDDCLYSLQASIPPHLTRSSLHRCFQRHGRSRLPAIAGEKPAKRPFKAYPIGYFHIDIAEVRTEEGKLHLFVAIDRTSKFAFAQLHEAANIHTAAAFLTAPIAAVPYKVHTVLTDNGVQFCNRTLKDATVRRYHYVSHSQLANHLAAFLEAYNFAKRLKTLRGLTPYECICNVWADEPDCFRYNPTHLTSGLNN
jgi:Integrase core domain